VIVETAIDFSGKKHDSLTNDKNNLLNIGDLCFVNYEYMFNNSSLKLEKQHSHNLFVYNRY